MLQSGQFATINELVKREGIAAPYLARTLRLSQLALGIVEAILAGRQPPGLTLEVLRGNVPDDWSQQVGSLMRRAE